MAANMLGAAFQRAFGKRFWLATALFIAALTFDSGLNLIKQLLKPAYIGNDICVFYYYFFPVSYGGVYCKYFAAMLAALPYATAYSEERDMLPFVIARTGVVQNSISKMVCSAVSGGAALALGSAFFIIGLSSKMPLVTESRLFESQWIPFYSLLNSGDGMWYFVVCIYLSFLTGFLWGGTAMYVSAYIRNELAVIAAPFVLSFLLVQINRLLRLGDNLRLDQLLSGRAWLGSCAATLLAATASVLVIWAVCALLFARKVKKELR
jgi:hypothetical protein